MENKPLIQFRNIVKSFDDQLVLKGINLDIFENEFVTLLGPSGCGKTTLLRILGGFLEQNSGEVYFDELEITKLPAYKREVNTVFQRYALFPHLNVYENIAFGLRIKKEDESIIKQKVERMLELVGLVGYEHRSVTKQCPVDNNNGLRLRVRLLMNQWFYSLTNLWEHSI
ncbi:ATP-binding cassette domain-containing protein [Erysipelothrix sp. D19-032]